MAMKKILYTIAVLAAVFALQSCEHAKFLDQYPYSQTSPENFYKTENSMYMALTAAYEGINTHKIPGASNMQRGSYAQGMLYIMNAPSDDMVAASSSSDEGLEMMWGNFNESTRCIREMWKVMYAGINRCNTLLHYIDNISMDESKKIQYKAEARFLRAFYYYHLAWNFGGVPVVEKIDSDGQEPRVSLEKLYTTVILPDLEYAYSQLNNVGLLGASSANKYTAAAYIARICNYLAACKDNKVGTALLADQPLNDFSFVDSKAMYKRSVEVCEDIINNSPYKLTSDYTNLFRETTKNRQYEECLFLAEQSLSGTEGWWPESFKLPSPTCNADSPTVWGGRFVPTPNAFYMYSPKDPRRDHNFTGRLQDPHEDGTPGKIAVKVEGYTYYNPDPPRVKVNKLGSDGEPETDSNGEIVQIEHPLYETDTQTYLPAKGVQVCPGKYRLCGIDEITRSYNQHSLSFPLMRLADVYLMYTEAKYFYDGTVDRSYLEKILLRACGNDSALCAELMDEYERTDFVDEILESRERELIFEFSRKWDLIRFNMMSEKINALDPDKVVPPARFTEPIEEEYLKYTSDSYLKMGIPTLRNNWAEHKIWLPISEEQRGVNKGLSQNAGWL